MRLIGNVEKDAQVRAVASGALPSGDAVIVNADGTVSVVAGSATSVGSNNTFPENTNQITMSSSAFDSSSNKVVTVYCDESDSTIKVVVGTVSGSSISYGTSATVSTGFSSSSESQGPRITFDSTNNKVVIVYHDSSNSGYGTARIGTVSGTSISLGTAQVFESSGSYNLGCTFNVTSGKCLIAFNAAGSSYYGQSIVGTVSGTSISFGTKVQFQANDSQYMSLASVDGTSNCVIAWKGISNDGYAVVASISGTSVSYGSAVIFEASTAYQISAVYDTNADKVVITYMRGGVAAAAIVGTVSGTSITFGTAVDFEDASTSNHRDATVFDNISNKVIIPIRDEYGPSDNGLIYVGSVSGDSITFDPPVTFEGGSNSARYITAAFDSNANKTVITYRDNGGTNGGVSVLFTLGSTNLTSENFLGFAAHTYADTQSALVNSTCTVDRNQSGLTAGQTYYVQADGSLGTTAADPSVVAGTAISSTEIIVKG